MSILLGIVAGFVPKLVTMIELRLCSSGVDLFRPPSALGENRYSLGQHFHKAARDIEALVSGLTAVQANLARTQQGEKRSMPIKHLKIAGLRRHLHGIRRLVDEDAIGSNKPDLQSIRIRHSYLYAVAFIFSAASSTSSMIPFM